MEDLCEITELPKSWCAHCKKVELPDPTDISDEEECLDWLDK